MVISGTLKSFFYRNKEFSQQLAEKCVGKNYRSRKLDRLALMIFTPEQEKRLQDVAYYLDNRKIDIIYALDKFWCPQKSEKKLKKFAQD